MHIFDLSICQWSTVAVAESVERIWHAGVWHSSDQSLYIYAGEDKNIFLQNDLFKITWKSTASPAASPDSKTTTDVKKASESAGSGSGSGGGGGGGTWIWSRVEYAGGADAPFPPDRYAHTATYRASDDSMIVFGGYGGEMTVFNDCYQYSFAHRRWRQLNPSKPHAVPTGRHAHSAVCCSDGSTVLVCGGKAESMANLSDLYQMTVSDGGDQKWLTDPVKSIPLWSCPTCSMVGTTTPSHLVY